MKIGPAAPRALEAPGSVEWCKGTLLLLQSICRQRQISEARFQELWHDIEQYHVWDIFPVDRPFGTPDRLLKETVGEDLVSIRSRCAMTLGATTKPTPPRQVGKGKAGPGRGKKTGDNITRLPASRGTSAEYWAGRLRRDAPTFADALARGEYKSVRAAAKAAGIVRDPTPAERIRKLWAKLTRTERRRFLEWIETDGG